MHDIVFFAITGLIAGAILCVMLLIYSLRKEAKTDVDRIFD